MKGQREELLPLTQGMRWRRGCSSDWLLLMLDSLAIMMSRDLVPDFMYLGKTWNTSDMEGTLSSPPPLLCIRWHTHGKL